MLIKPTEVAGGCFKAYFGKKKKKQLPEQGNTSD